jgi:hypothetical protein
MPLHGPRSYLNLPLLWWYAWKIPSFFVVPACLPSPPDISLALVKLYLGVLMVGHYGACGQITVLHYMPICLITFLLALVADYHYYM